MPCIAKLPPVRIGIEACGGAHYWARRFRAHGHEVKLMAPQFVKPYVKSNKNDSRDAEAIAEAVTRPPMRFVPIKDVDQQDIQALHRVRERLIGERTALVNEVHGLMHEYGIVMPKGVAKFRQAVVGKLEAEKDKLTPLSQEMFWKLVEEFAALEVQLAYYQEKLDARSCTAFLRIIQSTPKRGKMLPSPHMLEGVTPWSRIFFPLSSSWSYSSGFSSFCISPGPSAR